MNTKSTSQLKDIMLFTQERQAESPQTKEIHMYGQSLPQAFYNATAASGTQYKCKTKTKDMITHRTKSMNTRK